jgi:hypothetical protein
MEHQIDATITVLFLHLLLAIVSRTELKHVKIRSSKLLQKNIFEKLTVSQLVKKSGGILKTPKARDCVHGVRF